ncbi:MAG: META domain-containing protein [Gammaproteobacteria bacterium]|nr:META domain-containing protein [Gammaproteobacteria bacterium]
MPQLRLMQLVCSTVSAMVLAWTPATGLASPSLQALGNMSYAGIHDTPVKLDNGTYEGEPYAPGGASRPRVELLTDLYTVSDDTGTSFVLLSESAGGTGSNLYLAAVSPAGVNTGTVLIGDRVDVISLRSNNGKAILEYVTTGPGEPACCPTLRVSGTYAMQADGLAELSREEQGSISLASLAGTQWRLLQLDRETAVPDNVAVTAMFDAQRISGSAGCNRYFAGVTAATPYELTIAPAGATRVACPPPQMEIEGRFLGALENATQFNFRLGKLVIDYRDGDIQAALLFERSIANK